MAYDDLPAEQQQRLEHLIAIHDFAYSRGLAAPDLINDAQRHETPPILCEMDATWWHSRTKFKSFAQREFEAHCREWAESIEQYRYLLGVDNGLRVYQEDLIAHPESVYEKIFDLAGLPHHDAPSRFVRRTLLHPLDETTQCHVDVKEVLAARGTGPCGLAC